MRTPARIAATLAMMFAVGAAVAVGAIVDEAPVTTIGGLNTVLANPHGVGVDSAGHIYVANQGGAVNKYSWAATGDTAPVAVIPNPSGASVPLGVFVNSDDHVWVAYNGGRIAEFGPDPGAASVPLRVLEVDEPGMLNSYRSVVLDHNGFIYTSDCDEGIVKVFAPNASGRATPVRDIRGINTRLGPGLSGTGQSWGLEVASDGSILVAGGTQVLRFAPGATGNVAPVGSINVSPPFQYAIEVEQVASGNVYVLDRGDGAVYIFPPSALDSGADVDTPITVIHGSSTQLVSPAGLAVDPATGTIVVGDVYGNDVARFAAREPGGRAPGGSGNPGGGGPGGPGSGQGTGGTGSGSGASGSGDPGGSTASPSESRHRTGVSIECGSRFTDTPQVTLCLRWPEGATRMALSNDGGFDDALVVPVAERRRWTLESTGPDRLPKTVYVRFEGPGVNREITYTDDIVLDQTAPEVVTATVQAAPASMQARAGVGRVLLRVRARDSQSSIARMSISINGRALTTRAFARSVRIPQAARVRVRVRDRAGNWSAWRVARSA